MRNAVFSAACMFGLPAACAAQALVTHSFSFVEVVAGSNSPVPQPNGVIEPGEGARIVLEASFVPAVGSTMAYTLPSPGGIGVVAGLFDQCFNLRGLNGAQGTWSGFGRAPGWDQSGLSSPSADGTTVGIFFSQSLFAPGPIANPQNPIPAIWWGVWSPWSYAPRTVDFGSRLLCVNGTSSLALEYGRDPNTGAPLYTMARVGTVYGNVLIPIVPAPAGAGVLLFAGLAAGGRASRRR